MCNADVPTVHPTEEQFSDPMAYVRSLEALGTRFGILKIVPPTGWKLPPRRKDARDAKRFDTKLQRVHLLQVGAARCGVAVRCGAVRCTGTQRVLRLLRLGRRRRAGRTATAACTARLRTRAWQTHFRERGACRGRARRLCSVSALQCR